MMGTYIRDTLLSLRGTRNESATLGKEITQVVELLCFHIASHTSFFLMFLYCPEFEGAVLMKKGKSGQRYILEIGLTKLLIN